MRIIFIPQYPTSMRYSEWWFWRFPHEFRERGYETIVIGEKYAEVIGGRRALNLVHFAPQHMAVEFECEQIKEYMNLELKIDDIVFHTDLSFPGLFHNVLFHKRPEKCFAFCHATAANYLDYYENDAHIKFPIEQFTAEIYEKVFIGSHYHQNKINFLNSVVTYLPPPPFVSEAGRHEKEHDIISVARPSSQKINQEVEDEIEANFGWIYRPTSHSWAEYYINLAKSKILLITSKEETFGYQILDAVINGCIPLAPNNLCYPEILPKAYLYDNTDQLSDKIFTILNNNVPIEKMVPEIICEQQIINFYDTLIKEMTDAVSHI